MKLTPKQHGNIAKCGFKITDALLQANLVYYYHSAFDTQGTYFSERFKRKTN